MQADHRTAHSTRVPSRCGLGSHAYASWLLGHGDTRGAPGAPGTRTSGVREQSTSKEGHRHDEADTRQKDDRHDVLLRAVKHLDRLAWTLEDLRAQIINGEHGLCEIVDTEEEVYDLVLRMLLPIWLASSPGCS